jgi:hypothetical protein
VPSTKYSVLAECDLSGLVSRNVYLNKIFNSAGASHSRGMCGCYCLLVTLSTNKVAFYSQFQEVAL